MVASYTKVHQLLGVFFISGVGCQPTPDVIVVSDEPLIDASRAASAQVHEKMSIDTKENLPSDEYLLRKAKSAEARIGLAIIIDASTMHPDKEMGICSVMPTGKVGPTPSAAIDCTKGPDRTCVAIDPPSTPQHPWEYSSEDWTTRLWSEFGYRRYDDHHYRYSLEWETADEGEEFPCRVKAIATGDLDGDGIVARFELALAPPQEEGGSWLSRNIVNEFE